jgi:hypothetical protein
MSTSSPSSSSPSPSVDHASFIQRQAPPQQLELNELAARDVHAMLARFDEIVASGAFITMPMWHKAFKACCFNGRCDVVVSSYLPAILRRPKRPDQFTTMHKQAITWMCDVKDYEHAALYMTTLFKAGTKLPLTVRLLSEMCEANQVRAAFELYNELVLGDDEPLSEPLSNLLVRHLSQAVMVDELRAVVARFISDHGRISPAMILPLLRAEYAAGNAEEARALLLSLPPESISIKLFAVLVVTETTYGGAGGLFRLFTIAADCGVVDASFAFSVASRLEHMGEFASALAVIRRAAQLGCVFDTKAALLVIKCVDVTTERVPNAPAHAAQDAAFLESLLALPDAVLFDMARHTERARAELDFSLPLVVNTYRAFCRLPDADGATVSVTRDSPVAAAAFAPMIVPFFLHAVLLSCVQQHGFATAWHLGAFLFPAMQQGDPIVASLMFHLLFELYPTDQGRRVARARFAQSAVISPPVFVSPCLLCGKPGHTAIFCPQQAHKV